MVKHFDLVGSGLVWRIGNGRMVRIGIDPWVGCGGDRVLPEELRLHLEARGCHYIADIEDQENSSLWHQGWISAQRLEIYADLQVIWGGYIRRLRVSNVRLTNRVDELVWWWNQLWKLKCPGKAKLLFWSILENKAPTWDILQNIFLEGPGFCALCQKK